MKFFSFKLDHRNFDKFFQKMRNSGLDLYAWKTQEIALMLLKFLTFFVSTFVANMNFVLFVFFFLLDSGITDVSAFLPQEKKIISNRNTTFVTID